MTAIALIGVLPVVSCAPAVPEKEEVEYTLEVKLDDGTTPSELSVGKEATTINLNITSNGEWQMTDYDLGKNMSVLPQVVYDAFMNGNYASWRVDDVSKYERLSDEFYLIEIETQGQRDRDLYFSPEGRLLKDEPDRENDDVTPSVVFQ